VMRDRQQQPQFERRSPQPQPQAQQAPQQGGGDRGDRGQGRGGWRRNM
jgi:hypothetical protein